MTQQPWLLLFTFSPLLFCFFFLNLLFMPHFFSLAGHLVGLIKVGKVRKAFRILGLDERNGTYVHVGG